MGSLARLVGARPLPDDDGDAAAARRQDGARRRLAALLRPSAETNVVALVSSGLTTAVVVLLAVSVYRLHDRVRILELHCAAGPSQLTEDTRGDSVVDKVRRSVTDCYARTT